MPRRYTSHDEDSGRWDGFEFRDGDIVISTRSKSGTTWMQMICLLLVFGDPRLPAPIPRLSPWLDWTTKPVTDVYAQLAAQTHRRVIKTHTPLDGVPLDPRATYVVVARHPLDMAVSLYHQGDNIDRTKWRALTGQPEPAGPSKPREPLHNWLLDWIDYDGDPRESLDDLPGVCLHAGDAWARRDEPNVLLVHYADLSADLDGEMRRVAGRLGFDIDPAVWPHLVEAATFDRMRETGSRAMPADNGVLKDPRAFFRRGRCGDGRAALTDDEYAHYLDRVHTMLGADVFTWLHR